MKKAFRALIVRALESQVARLRKKNTFKIIGVVGSIGKTSTKLAIARSLSEVCSVRFQEGNYNDAVTVPLVFFGQRNPSSVTNIFAWLKILIGNELQILRPYRFEYVVIEIGTDAPGQISRFGEYIELDVAVITAITPEHMEFFEDIDAVAREELSVLSYAKSSLLNRDLCDERFLSADQSGVRFYGMDEKSDYLLEVSKKENAFCVTHRSDKIFEDTYTILQVPKLYSLTAAAAVLVESRFSSNQVKDALQVIGQMETPGRLSLLNGIFESKIIDDTYNSSPEAVKFALDILYDFPAAQRIAILGSMNELGHASASLHKEIGEYCDPKRIDLLVTIGEAANNELADAAEVKGCTVKRCMSPYEAGAFVKTQIKEQAAILAKGSQNGVFAEEAVKYLLEKKEDENRLVRQSESWLQKKARQFGKIADAK